MYHQHSYFTYQECVKQVFYLSVFQIPKVAKDMIIKKNPQTEYHISRKSHQETYKVHTYNYTTVLNVCIFKFTWCGGHFTSVWYEINEWNIKVWPLLLCPVGHPDTHKVSRRAASSCYCNGIRCSQNSFGIYCFNIRLFINLVYLGKVNIFGYNNNPLEYPLSFIVRVYIINKTLKYVRDK